MLRSSVLAMALLAFSGGAGAAGLGRINVLSALGQPLRAEIEILATPDELESMSAKIASADAYQRANIEYSSVFSAVKMSVEKRSAKGGVVRVVSSQPINEPFVDMLVELNWAGGRLLHEYTFLLDPSQDQQIDNQQHAPIAVEQPVSKPLSPADRRKAARAAKDKDKEAATSVTQPASTPAPAPAAEKKAEPAAASTGEGYTIKRGDTLSKIATEVKPVEVSQEQMVAALYKANAQAFVGGNINRLRTGRVLRVPDADEAKQLNPTQARQVILKASSFEEYKQKLASAAAAAPAKEAAPNQASSGKVESKVEDKVPAQAAQKDKVKVTSTQVGKASDTTAGDNASKARVQSLQDTLATRDKELKEANSRIQELDKNISELKKLIELKNQEMAETQRKASDALKAKEANKGKKGLDAEPAPAVTASAATPVEATKPAETLAPAADSAPVAVQSAVVEASAPVAPVSEPAPQASAPVAKPAPRIQPAPEPEPESDIPYVPIAGVALAAILGLAGWMMVRRRRKKNEGFSQLSEVSTTSPNSVFGSAAGQTIDTGGTSLLHTDFSQSGMAAIDADEGVDPVAEADVYMAYGRDAQAEEILLDAIKTDPNRNAIYLKLLEIYAQRKSPKQFESIAAELHTRTNGTGPDWAKAVALGLQLDPENPLFRTGSAEAAPVAPVVAPEPAPVAAAPVAPAAAPAPAPAAPVEPVSFGTNNVSQMRSTWTVPGELNQLNTTAGPGEMPVVELPQVGTASVPDSLNLDFNLDLDSPEVEDQPTRVEPRKKAPAPAAEPAPAAPAPVAAAPAPAEEVPLEFDIGFDDAAETTGGVEPLSFELPVSQPVAPHAAHDEMDVGIESARQDKLAEVDLEKTNFEGSLLDFDFELGDEVHKPALDLSAVNLQTSTPGSQPAAPVASADAQSAVDLPDIGSGDDLDVGDEIATKLELAHAYEEMGDVEGARELIEEVIADGTPAQQQEARAVLQRLGG